MANVEAADSGFLNSSTADILDGIVLCRVGCVLCIVGYLVEFLVSTNECQL